MYVFLITIDFSFFVSSAFNLHVLLQKSVPIIAGFTLAYFNPNIVPLIKGLVQTKLLLVLMVMFSYIILIFCIDVFWPPAYGSIPDYLERALNFAYYYFYGAVNDTWPQNKSKWQSVSEKGKALARKIALVHRVPKPNYG